MAIDVNAREITINYDGGSLTMTVGNAKDLFGENNPLVAAVGIPTEVSVKAHSRTRIIGGPTTSVSANTYTYTQWPVGGHGQAAGGTPVMMYWTGSDGVWQARVSGALWEFGEFLKTASPKNVWFTAKGGQSYGPFINSTQG